MFSSAKARKHNVLIFIIIVVALMPKLLLAAAAVDEMFLAWFANCESNTLLVVLWLFGSLHVGSRQYWIASIYGLVLTHPQLDAFAFRYSRVKLVALDWSR